MTNPATLIAGFLTIASLGGFSAAQPQPAPLAAAQLKDGVYWVKGGSGANTGFIIGAKEVIVIDAKMSEESAKADARRDSETDPESRRNTSFSRTAMATTSTASPRFPRR